MPMQPRPMAETVRPWRPSWRRGILLMQCTPCEGVGDGSHRRHRGPPGASRMLGDHCLILHAGVVASAGSRTIVHMTTAEELIELVKTFAPHDGLHDTAIDPLQLIRMSAPAQRLPAVYEPGLCVVVQGRKHARIGSDLLVYDALNYLVISVTMLPPAHVVEASDDKPYLCIRLNVDPRELGSLLLEAAPTVAEEVGCGLRVSRVSETLLDAVLRLVRLLRTPRDAPVLAPLALREIYYRV